MINPNTIVRISNIKWDTKDIDEDVKAIYENDILPVRYLTKDDIEEYEASYGDGYLDPKKILEFVGNREGVNIETADIDAVICDYPRYSVIKNNFRNVVRDWDTKKYIFSSLRYEDSKEYALKRNFEAEIEKGNQINLETGEKLANIEKKVLYVYGVRKYRDECHSFKREIEIYTDDNNTWKPCQKTGDNLFFTHNVSGFFYKSSEGDVNRYNENTDYPDTPIVYDVFLTEENDAKGFGLIDAAIKEYIDKLMIEVNRMEQLREVLPNNVEKSLFEKTDEEDIER